MKILKIYINKQKNYYNKLKKANARVKLVDNTELADHILGQVNYAYRVTCEKAYCN